MLIVLKIFIYKFLLFIFVKFTLRNIICQVEDKNEILEPVYFFIIDNIS